MPDSAGHPVQIYLLGRFEVVQGEHRLQSAGWRRRKAAALFQRLALERRLVKDKATDFLWPDSSPSSAANNLYRTLYAVRQTLNGAFGPDAADAIFSFEDSVLALDASVWVDAHAFERLCSNHEASIAELQQALELYKGELLPDDPYGDWLFFPRDSLHRLYHEASLNLAGRYREQQAFDRAAALLTPLLAHDPADEPVHRELMRLYALAGHRHDALRQYRACVQALEEDLGVPPEPETVALYEQLLSNQRPPSPALAGQEASGQAAMPATIVIEPGAPFVGRAQELAVIRDEMKAGQSGQGRTILLAGDTGVGKTRLAYEALQAAASAGMTTLHGAFYEQEGQLPYQPFVEAINRYLLAQRRSLSDNPITNFKPLGVTDPQQEHWALFNATVNFLVAQSRQAPLVLLIDDLHAADETSMQLFHFLARQTRQAPIVLLATYRTDILLEPTSPFDTLLNALYREQLRTDIRLASVNQGPVERIVAYGLEGDPAPELVGAIFEATDGNPFFVEEMTRALRKWGLVEERGEHWHLKEDAALRVPPELGGLLRERVANLGEPVMRALGMASIIGREFSFDILRRIAVMSEEALLDALEAALDGSLLEETLPGYRFRHNLIRRVLYDSQSKPRQARLHRLTAKTIEELFGRQPEGLAPFAETLAHHYIHSDDRRSALPYLVQAGEKAADFFAFEVAAGYFEQAKSLMDEFSLNDPERQWHILESLGWWGIILADTPKAVARFEQALSLVPTEAWQPSQEGQALLHRGAAVALLTIGDTAGAEEHLRAALSLVDEAENAAVYAHVLYNMAQLHWHQNEYQEAFEVAQRSLSIAEQLDDEVAIARAFEMLALACHSTGDWQQGLVFEDKRSEMIGPELDVSDAFDVHL